MSEEALDHVFIGPTNFDKSLAFYKDTLGFEVFSSWGGGGEPRGAQLRLGTIILVLAEADRELAGRGGSEGQKGARPTIHVRTDDVDRRFSKLPGGDHIKVPPEYTHWGKRWFVVEDPDGNLIAFVSG